MNCNSFEDTGLVKALRFLKAHNTEYLSGQDLSDVLKVSRVAVWKYIKKIRDMGYTIESKQRTGYRFVADSDLLLPWEITTNLTTRKIGRRVYYYDQVDSTQSVALQMINDTVYNNTTFDNTLHDGTVIIAQRQTRGRGRHHKRWISQDGAITMSIILQPRLDIETIALFPAAAALALARAIKDTLHKTVRLRWPNDVMLQGKKVAGILVDVSLESNRIKYLVLGVGINFDVKVSDITKEIKDAKYNIASLNGKGTRPVILVQKFLVELEDIINNLESKRITNIIDEWTDKSDTIGKKIMINTTDGTVHGKATRMDQDGALVVVSDEIKYRIIDSNDILY